MPPSPEGRKPKFLFLDSRNLSEWSPLLARAEVAALPLPGHEYVLNDLASGQGLEPDRCLEIAVQHSGQFDYIIGECTGAFLWHAIFRSAGDRTPFIIIPRFNHVAPFHAYAALLSSQFRQSGDRLYTGCTAAGHSFAQFGFHCEPSYLPGLNLKEFKVLRDQRDGLRSRLGLPLDRDVLLYTGRMADDKNILELMDIFAAVQRSRKAELVICYHFFQPAYLDRCRERGHSIGNVRIVHRPSPETLVQYYNAADLFVSAAISLFETFGRSPVEAMACGAPPVVPEYDGFRETVTPETGFLVAPMIEEGQKRPDAGAFVTTILDALEDRQALPVKAAAGVAQAEQFEIERTLGALLGSLASASCPQPDERAEPPEFLSFRGYPPQVRALWPALEGKPLARLVTDLVSTGKLPALPSRVAAESFYTSWFAEF